MFTILFFMGVSRGAFLIENETKEQGSKFLYLILMDFNIRLLSISVNKGL